jgi:protein-tyrosine phosphatase
MAVDNFSWVIPGKLAGCAMPGGSGVASYPYLDADLLELHEQGVEVLISLKDVPPGFEQRVGAAGLVWHSFPIEDFGLPQDKQAFEGLVEFVLAQMREGRGVCAHCHAGIGRTGLLLGCVLGRYLGIDGALAVRSIRKNRPSLDTPAQVDFVHRFLNR